MGDTAPGTLLTTAQVAELLGLTEQRVRYWRHEGSGPPYVKLGRAVRYRPADVEDYLNANTRRAG
jgi:excisionase family DNA binding protein